MWSMPKDKGNIDCLAEYSGEGDQGKRPVLMDIIFSEVRIQKAIASVRMGVVSGPDGISPFPLKLFSDQLAEPQHIIYEFILCLIFAPNLNHNLH